MSQIYSNNKNAAVAHQADHDNGLWPYSTTNHKNDNADLLIRAIATTGLSFITVDCCLVSRFKDLVEMAPQ
jgi:hypothetical protein